MRRFSVLKFISDGFLSDGIPSVTSFPSPNMNSANVEESDMVFEDPQVDAYDVLDHDDVKITEFIVNDSVVAGSHLSKHVTGEVSPIAANKEAIEETNHGDIVSSGQTQFLNGINSPLHTKDSMISVNIAHLNLRALIDTGAARRYCSKCSRLAKVCK